MAIVPSNNLHALLNEVNGGLGRENFSSRFITELKKEIKTEIEKEFVKGGEKYKIVSGIVSSAGTKVVGSGFSVAHPEAGVYVLTFSSAFSVLPQVVAVDTQGTQRTGSTSTESTTQVKVIMSNGVAAKENISFSFIAIG